MRDGEARGVSRKSRGPGSLAAPQHVKGQTLSPGGLGTDPSPAIKPPWGGRRVYAASLGLSTLPLGLGPRRAGRCEGQGLIGGGQGALPWAPPAERPQPTRHSPGDQPGQALGPDSRLLPQFGGPTGLLLLKDAWRFPRSPQRPCPPHPHFPTSSLNFIPDPHTHLPAQHRLSPDMGTPFADLPPSWAHGSL